MSAPFDFKKEIVASKAAKARYTRLADLCRLFLDGRQNVTYDRRRDVLRVREVDDEERYADNAIKPLYKFIVSNLSVEYPSTSVLPASPSTEDILKARLSGEAAAYYWATNRFKWLIQQVVEWLAATGNCAIHTFYDARARSVVSKLVRFYDLFYQKGATSEEESAWVAVRTLPQRADMEEVYPTFAKAIKKAPAVAATGSVLEDDTIIEDSIELYDVYRRGGVHELRLQDEVLDETTWNEKTTPVRHVWYMRTPGLLWGQGAVGDLIDLQSLLNRRNQQINQAIENLADPWLLVPTGSAIPMDAFKRGADRVIRFSAVNGAPTALQVTPISADVYADVQRILGRMLDVAGAHSTSLGKTARGVTSAKQVDSLKAADASQLQPSMGCIEAAVVDVAKTALVLMKRYYTEARWVRFLDQTGSLIAKHIDFTQIEDDPEIIIEAGGLFRNETQDRHQKVLELFSMGLLSADAAMQEIAFGTSSKFVLDKVAAMVHAQDLLEGAKAGLDVKLYATDDTPAIRRVFQEFMQSPDFYALPLNIQDHVDTIFESMQPAPPPPGAQDIARLLKAQGQVGPGTAQVPGSPLPSALPQDTSPGEGMAAQ